MIATRRKALDAWLDRNHARLLWEQDDNREQFTLQMWGIAGGVLIVQDRHAYGWETFVPSSAQNSVEASLDGAALALNCQGCRGLI